MLQEIRKWKTPFILLCNLDFRAQCFGGGGTVGTVATVGGLRHFWLEAGGVDALLCRKSARVKEIGSYYS
jgi:hypothetical protein